MCPILNRNSRENMVCVLYNHNNYTDIKGSLKKRVKKMIGPFYGVLCWFSFTSIRMGTPPSHQI